MTLELLDSRDAIARMEYERAFYAAFQRVPGNRLVRKLWLWDDRAKRVATRISYEDQIVYLDRRDGAIDGAVAFNVRRPGAQSAFYGFSPPANTRGICEALTFFAVSDRRIATRYGFWRDSVADLHKRGFHTVYATASAPAYRVYRRFGATLLDRKEIEGETRFFFTFDVAETVACRRTGVSDVSTTDGRVTYTPVA